MRFTSLKSPSRSPATACCSGPWCHETFASARDLTKAAAGLYPSTGFTRGMSYTQAEQRVFDVDTFGGYDLDVSKAVDPVAAEAALAKILDSPS